MYYVNVYRIFPDGIVQDHRCVEIDRHWETVHDHCMDNYRDMFEEGYYNYALVAKVRENVAPHSEEIQWYHYGDDDSVCTVLRPDEAPYELPCFYR